MSAIRLKEPLGLLAWETEPERKSALERVDRWMMPLSHVLARWNLHFCAVGVFDQHAILIAPTVLDSADALRPNIPELAV